MKELILTSTDIEEIERTDRLYARSLKESRKTFISLVQQTPGYLNLITDELRDGDLYIARIPNEVIKGLQRGEYEKVYKKTTGLWNGMIRKADGKSLVLKQTEWQKAAFKPEHLANMAQIALQTSVAELTQMLFEIDKKISQVIAGQQADRIAKVQSGIDMYHQAYHSTDTQLQKMQLINALQTLNEGRRTLMKSLENTLRLPRREESLTDLLWRIIKVDKPEVDMFNHIQSSYEKSKEEIKYINLSSLYIFRIHCLLGQFESAEESRRQYVEFCDLLLAEIPNKEKYFPYEKDKHFSLPQLKSNFEEARSEVQQATASVGDLTIEITYQELTDESL